MPRTLDLKNKAEQLRSFFSRKKRMPGYNEMLQLFGYKSKNAVHGLLEKLAREGYISKSDRKIALTGKIMGTVRLLGTVQAGFPSPAEEELMDTMNMDDFLIEKPDQTFILKVTGDSMINAGIHPGDMVLVEKGSQARTNDIVIAQVDGEWTLKYFIKDQRGVRLEAANKKYSTILPRNSLEIGGIVKAVIRKYS